MKLFKSNQTGYGVYHGYLENKTKTIFAIACLGKKASFSDGNLRISRIKNLKNRSFSSGQAVIQIEPNWVWSMPWVPKV